jgi:hypothetical protein
VEVGRRCATLASYMLEQKQPLPQPANSRFVDYFAISPAGFAPTIMRLDDSVRSGRPCYIQNAFVQLAVFHTGNGGVASCMPSWEARGCI